MTCDMHMYTCMHMYMSCISQADGKRGVGANVTNGAPENAVLERYKRGRFAVRAHTVPEYSQYMYAVWLAVKRMYVLQNL